MISRRDFLKTAVSIAAVLPFTQAFASQNSERVLSLYSTHTGESLRACYYAAGRYDTAAIDAVNYLLRCHYTNEIRPIDIGVLDLLCAVKDLLGKDKQVEIISGYRSPAYNTYLLGLGRRVSKDSLHLQGLAVDLTIPGVSNHTLSRAAKSFGAGGVGRYSQFVHIDVGPVRYW